jgi:hypothetical protein
MNAFPTFKGKAANSRWVCVWLSDVMYELGEVTKEAALMWGLADALYILHEEEDAWLTQVVADRFAASVRLALLAYSALAAEAAAASLPLWCLKPKHHQLDHMADLVRRTRQNMRWHWAFADEDFNAKVMAISKSCHPKNLVRRTIQKYALRLCMLCQGGDA